MKKFFKWTALAAAGLVLVCGVALYTLDLGFLGGMAQSRVSKALGREFSSGDDLSVRLGKDLVIQARNLRLGNPGWAAAEDFLNVGHMRAVIDPWSLWGGPLLIRSIELEGLDIGLLQDEAGRSNWDFSDEQSAPRDARAGPMAMIESLLIADADIELQAARLDNPLRASVGRLEQSLDPGGMVRISLSGSLNGQPVRVDGSAGPHSRLHSGDDVTIEGRGSFGRMELSGSAAFDNLWSPRRPEIDLRLAGPDFGELTGMLSIEGLGAGNVSLDATTRPDGDSLVVRLAGNLGQFEIDFESAMSDLGDLATATFDTRISGPNFGRVARLAGQEGWPEDPFELSARLQRPEGGLQIERLGLSLAEATFRLQGSIPGFPGMGGAELSVRASGPDLAPFGRLIGLENTVSGRFDLSGKISTTDGTTGVDIGFQSRLASGSVSGIIGGGEDLAGSELAIEAQGPEASAIAEIAGLPGLAEGPWSLNMPVSIDEPDRYRLGEASFRTSSLELEVRGSVGARSIEEGTDVRFLVRGDSLASFQEAFGEDWALPEGSFSLNGQARSDAGSWTLTGVTGNAGTTSIALDGTVVPGPPLSGTSLKLRLSGERLADYQGLAGEAIDLPEQSFEIDGEASFTGEAWNFSPLNGRVGSTRFTLDGRLGGGDSLAGTDLTLVASGNDLGAIFDIPGQARLPDGPFTLQSSIRLDRGRLEIGRLNIDSGPFKLKLDADLPWPVGISDGRFSLDTSGVDITRVLPELAGMHLDEVEYSVRINGGMKDGSISIQDGLARIGDSSISVKGTLDLPPNLSATDLNVGLHSPDLSRLGTIDGERWGRVPLDFNAVFKGDATRFEMQSFRAKLGESNIRGAFSLSFERKVPEFDLRLSITALNLKPFQLDRENETDPGASAEQGDALLIPDTVLPMDWLARVNGRFALVADRVYLKRVTLENNALAGEVRDGALQVNELGTDGYGGRLTATLSLAPVAGGGGMLATTVHSTGLIIDFADQPDEYKQSLPPFDIDIDLRGEGSTLREVSSGLNGDITIYSSGGIVRNTGEVGTKSPVLAQVVSAISPQASRQKEIAISCIAAVIPAREGVLNLDPGVAIQSDKLNIFASGKVNLGNEKIDVNLRTQTRKAVDISVSEVFSPYVKLAGTLAAPSVTIDPKGTLLSGGAAYLSGGLSILAKKALDQLGGTRDPCAEFLEKAPPQDG